MLCSHVVVAQIAVLEGLLGEVQEHHQQARAEQQAALEGGLIYLMKLVAMNSCAMKLSKYRQLAK